jgi:hypothetical protein
MARITSLAKWQEWEDRFTRFERQALPIRQFCEAEGVSPGTFWYWRRNLAGNATPRPNQPTRREAAFTPVDVIEPSPVACIVIRLPHGASVELPGDRPDLLETALVVLTAEGSGC